jgi:AraC-like DNA-binding protein
MDSSVVFSSPSLTISDVWCEPGPIPKSNLEVEIAFGVSFPRAGVYVHHTPEGPIVAEPNVAVLHNIGDEHATTHPTFEGDRNTDLGLAPTIVEPLLDLDDRFRARMVPITDEIAARLRRLLSVVERGTGSTLEIEEEAIDLVRATQEMTPFPEGSGRHRSLVDDTRQYLAHHFHLDLDLATVAAAVGASPFHLSRVFKESTGFSLTRYRTALRVRSAIEMIAGGADNLSRVAVEAGFFDHAHMTKTFAMRLGKSPSKLRSWMAG